MVRNTLDTGRLFPFGDEWHIEDEIGSGSYGVVFRIARNDDSGMLSAMKWIPLPEDDAQVSRMLAEGSTMTGVREYYARLKGSFIEEIKLLNKLRGNSHIVSLEDYKVIPREGADTIGYDIYIRMELLTPLNKYINSHAMTYQDVLQLGIDLCSALADCRKYNIIHRDIKPDNIFVTDSKKFKLGDFGIARQLQQAGAAVSQRVGSLAYMAPEVYNSAEYDHRADIYSLGLVLFKLLNHRRDPFVSKDAAYVSQDEEKIALDTRMSGKPLPPPDNLPSSLVRLGDILKKACAFDPEARYQEPEEMREALAAMLSLPGLSAEVYKPESRSKPADKRPEPVLPKSENSTGTAKRTPSSIYGEVGRVTTTENTPVTPPVVEDKPEKGGSVADDAPTPAPKPRRKTLLIAAAALLVIAAGVLAFLFFNQAHTPGYTIMTEDLGSTSVSVSWNTEKPEQPLPSRVRYRLVNNGAVIREEDIGGKSVVLTGLTPATDYTVEFTLDGQTVSSSFRTRNESKTTDLPLVSQVDLSVIEKFYLTRYAGIDSVPAEYFDLLTDNRLGLRTGPMAAQTKGVVLWIMFEPNPTARKCELLLSLTPENGPAFTGSHTLELKQTEKTQSFSVSLDSLLDQVYSKYNSWPGGTASLRLYLDGMSVDAISMTF